MNANRYLRDRLPATRNQVCDPSCVVESRLALLADLLDGWSPNGPDQFAYDMLAALGWLQRTDLRLLAKLDPAGLVAAGRAYAGAHGKELAARALAVPDPQAWLDEAKDLRASYEELMEPVERAELAHRLINELDDAELVLLEAMRLGMQDELLESELERCRAWLRDDADAFLAAGVFVQATGLALRADLDTVDPDLGRTAEKFAHILDALENMEHQLEPDRLGPLSPEFVGLVLERFWATHGRDKEQSPPQADVLSFPVNPSSFGQPLPFAAQAAGQSAGPIMATWRSPEHRLFAFLEIYSLPASNTEPVTITFFDSQDLPAVELVGQPVKLRDYSTTIKQSGANVVALVPWGNLPQLGEPVRVGPDLTEWVAETAASSR